MYVREQIHILEERIKEQRSSIQVIVGPRQVGKSTLVKQLLSSIDIPNHAVSADNVGAGNPGWISEQWSTARAMMKLSGAEEFLLVIDEVHKVPNWSESVKKEWDSDTFNDINIKVILLGSSRLLIKDGLSESLAGRFELIRMPHWSFKEINEAFGLDIDSYIYFGGYPGGIKYIGDERRWRKYMRDSIITPAVDKDVLTTKRVLKPELMHRLFELGCSYSGEEISLNKILGQLQDAGNVTTLSSYLTTLDESNLLCGLKKYSADKARKYNSVPKMMVYNTALLSAESGISFKTAYTSPKIWGRWVESAVGAYLLNFSEELDYKLYYWREGDNEVDFVIDNGHGHIAVEVKSGRRTAGEGFQIFRERFHPLHSLTVGTGGIPLEDFLKADLEKLFG